jgi:acyl carrier protein
MFGQHRRTLVPRVREHLRSKLPDFMVPTAYVVMAEMPLTANGKVNRKALPAPEQGVSDRHYMPPRTPLEDALARVFAEVLGIDRVGVFDDFFDLGGHSLLATQLVSRIRRTFDHDLPLMTVFETPTVAALAEHIDTLSWARRSSDEHVTEGPDDDVELVI